MMSHSSSLGDEARTVLLARARQSITVGLSGAALGPLECALRELDEPRGCFVTLHGEDGDLRGCLGTFDDSLPLVRNVESMALAAATRDPRFAPVEPGELDACVIEVSALTPRRAARLEDVQVGEHGVWLEQGGRRGVLLPQVATEHGWDALTFVERTCQKAGLPRDAWRDARANLMIFSAEIFAEVREQGPRRVGARSSA
jgi:uncharacterized protein